MGRHYESGLVRLGVACTAEATLTTDKIAKWTRIKV